MDVKQRKPRLGRRPSPRLWEMVRGYTDDEWRQFKAFSEVYGKGSQQFRLLDFHRYQERYDPELEKETFADVALTSMRNTARNWLVRTGIRLALMANELEELTQDVDELLRRGYPDVALEHHTEAKRMALAQEEFGWLARLLKQEMVLMKLLHSGEERAQNMVRVSQEAIANAKLLVLEAEISAMEVRYIDNPRMKLTETAIFSNSSVGDYFASDFYKQSISNWPISFQVRKLKIDDLNHYYLGEIGEAMNVAGQIREIFSSCYPIRSTMAAEHGKCLYRLFAYYSEFNDREGERCVLGWMRECMPELPENRDSYLGLYIYILFRIGLSSIDWTLVHEGSRIWEENSAFFEVPSRNNLLIGNLLHMAAFHLAVGESEQVKKIVSKLAGYRDSEMATPYWAFLRILHLIALVDDVDIRGLESHGTNYKRHIRRRLPKSSPLIGIVSLLSRPTNLDGKIKQQSMLRELLAVLHSCEKSNETSLKPFIQPLIKWAAAKLQN